MLVNY